MNNINTQAKNEVRELLGELVVSPVTSDVKGIIQRSEESLSTLSVKQNNKILGLSTLLITIKKKIMSEDITHRPRWPLSRRLSAFPLPVSVSMLTWRICPAFSTDSELLSSPHRRASSPTRKPGNLA